MAPSDTASGSPPDGGGVPGPHGVYSWHPRVASRTLDGTAFLLLDSRMLSLNPVGTHIWEACRDGATLGRVAAEIAQEFATTETTAARDAETFIADLVARGMLIANEAAPE